ncbi:MAG: glycosyltransferase family 39 protein [Desulfobacteraceae bacterium]|nr:glycosyltransferase family 39 protein [Desulfobacteraceae bacterium]
MKASIFLIAISLLLRLLILGTYFFNQPDMIFKPDAPDNWEYHFLGKNLVEYHTFSSDSIPPLKPDAIRTPVYPLFIGILYTFFGDSPKTVIFVQALLGSATVLIFFRLCQLFLSVRMAFLAALLFAFEPFAILFTGFYMTETLFTFFLCLSFYYLSKYFDSGSLANCLYSSLFLGLTALCRPIIQFYIPLIVVAIFYSPLLRQVRRKKRLVHAALYFGVCLLMIFAWSLRNQIEFGQFKLSTIDEVNLSRYEIPKFRYYSGEISIDNEQRNTYSEYVNLVLKHPVYFVELQAYYIYKYLFDLGRGYLFFPEVCDRYSLKNVTPKAGLLGLIKWDIFDCMRAINDVVLKRPGYKGLLVGSFFLGYLSYLLFLYLLFPIGIIKAWKERNFCVLVLAATFAYGAAFSGSVAAVRFRLPFTFALIGVAFYGLESLLHRCEIRQFSIKEDA